MIRKYKIQLFGITALSLAISCPLLLTGCGPSEEYKNIKRELEQFPKVTERNAEVGKIHFLPRENQRGNDLRFEADLLDKDGKVIGKAGGFRVEGSARESFVFATMMNLNSPLEQVLAQHPDIVRRNAIVGKIDFIERPEEGEKNQFCATFWIKTKYHRKVMGSHIDGVGHTVSCPLF
jgi:hypothetical protein